MRFPPGLKETNPLTTHGLKNATIGTDTLAEHGHLGGARTPWRSTDTLAEHGYLGGARTPWRSECHCGAAVERAGGLKRLQKKGATCPLEVCLNVLSNHLRHYSTLKRKPAFRFGFIIQSKV